MSEPIYRLAERNCWCRICDSQLTKQEDKAVFWYSFANRGMNIIICPDCIRSLYAMVRTEDE